MSVFLTLGLLFLVLGELCEKRRPRAGWLLLSLIALVIALAIHTAELFAPLIGA